MRFNVAQLIKGSAGEARQYDLCEKIGNLDPALEPLSPLEGRVTLMRTSQGVLATGRLRTRLQVECRRCLEPFSMDVEYHLEEEFVPIVRIGDSPLDSVALEEIDEALLIDAEHTLDLTEVVRQALLLEESQAGVCRPDCAGLCPSCGGNRNLEECQCDATPIDPRWAALQAILTVEPESQERSD